MLMESPAKQPFCEHVLVAFHTLIQHNPGSNRVITSANRSSSNQKKSFSEIWKPVMEIAVGNRKWVYQYDGQDNTDFNSKKGIEKNFLPLQMNGPVT